MTNNTDKSEKVLSKTLIVAAPVILKALEDLVNENTKQLVDVTIIDARSKRERALYVKAIEAIKLAYGHNVKS